MRFLSGYASIWVKARLPLGDVTSLKDHFRLKVDNPEEKRALSLEIYPETALGETSGMLVVIYTGNSHLQLHNCTGYVVSEEWDFGDGTPMVEAFVCPRTADPAWCTGVCAVGGPGGECNWFGGRCLCFLASGEPLRVTHAYADAGT